MKPHNGLSRLHEPRREAAVEPDADTRGPAWAGVSLLECTLLDVTTVETRTLEPEEVCDE
jgi:hypothetical protein